MDIQCLFRVTQLLQLPQLLYHIEKFPQTVMYPHPVLYVFARKQKR